MDASYRGEGRAGEGIKSLHNPLDGFQSDEPRRDSKDQLEGFQNDEPPRRNLGNGGNPYEWSEQGQGRLRFLRSENDQYLQITETDISGTLEVYPDTGVFQLFSHQKHVIIKSLFYKSFLCMNATGELYVRKNLHSDCYINETNRANKTGSHLNYYEFQSHRTADQEFYLGVNCDPLHPSLDDKDKKSFRFLPLALDPMRVKRITKLLNTKDPPRSGKKCTVNKRTTEEEKKQKLREKRLRYRRKWCWNLGRLTRNITKVNDASYNKTIADCYSRHQLGCQNPDRNKPCMCEMLRKMIDQRKRKTRRNCLTMKINSYIKDNKRQPKDETVKLVANKLLKHYDAIAARYRYAKRPSKQKPSRKERSRMCKLKPLLEAHLRELSTNKASAQPRHIHPRLSHKLLSDIENMCKKKQTITRKDKKKRHRRRRKKSKIKKCRHKNEVKRKNCIQQRERQRKRRRRPRSVDSG